jgi:hypothetical protein
MGTLRIEIRVTSKSGKRRRTRGYRADFDPPDAQSRRAKPKIPSVQGKTCTVFAALGHPQRVQLLLSILRGGGTYSDLRKATGLQPGPLYHHINELRLAGLIGPKSRDNYELTDLGVQAALTGVVLGKVWSARR